MGPSFYWPAAGQLALLSQLWTIVATMHERVWEFGMKWIEFYKISCKHLGSHAGNFSTSKSEFDIKEIPSWPRFTLTDLVCLWLCLAAWLNHLMRAAVRALTTPAPHHPGWNAVGPALAGGAGCCRVFRRARFGPLLLQQVRQCPGDQQQSQYVNVLVDAGSSKTLVENQAFLCLPPPEIQARFPAICSSLDSGACWVGL